MATASSAPYVYPTPEMIAAEPLAANRMPGRPLQIELGPTGTPLVAGAVPTIRQLATGLRQRIGIWILGADSGQALFPPQQPLQPIAQPIVTGAPGRPWDYPVGWNTRVTPRSGVPIAFSTLKNLANGYDILRILIERVKDKVAAQTWTVGMADKKQQRDSRCDQLADFFAYPDKLHTWKDWLRQLLEQTIVYDAPAIWLRPNRAGELFALELMDGAMFSPKIMADGRLPPPEYGPAYQQVLKGMPAVDYIQPVPKGQPVPVAPDGWPFHELLYKPRNPRVDSVYGFGPVEQIIATIGIGLRREEYLSAYYQHGSAPDLLIGTPETWSQKQVAEMQNLFDGMLSGNLEERRRARFIPGGTKPFDLREKALTDETDQWLIRIMCFCLGLSPMPFVKAMNKGQEHMHHQEAVEEGLGPWLEFVAELLNHVIMLKFGWRDVQFRWEESEVVDPLEEAQRYQIYLVNKVYHPDEVRARLGDDAMAPDMRAEMDLATVNAAPNATILPPDQQAARDAANEAKAAATAAAGAQFAGAQKRDDAAATERFEKMLAALKPEPTKIIVESPQITLPAITLPAMTLNAPGAPVTVNMPEIRLPDYKAPDVFVDVGSTTVQAKFDAPKGADARAGLTKTVTAERGPDGKLVGKITESKTRNIIAGRDADGKLTATLTEG